MKIWNLDKDYLNVIDEQATDEADDDMSIKQLFCAVL